MACAHVMKKLEEINKKADKEIARLQRMRSYPFEFEPDTSDRSIDDRIEALRDIEGQIEDKVSEIFDNPAKADLTIPTFDLDAAAGFFPKELQSATVPIKIEVTDNKGGSYSGDGSDWIGPAIETHLWIDHLRIWMIPDVFRRIDSPLQIELSYCFVNGRLFQGVQVNQSAWLDADKSLPPAPGLGDPVAIVIRLKGDDAGLYDIEYQVKRANGVITPSHFNGDPAGNGPGQPRNQPPLLCQIKVKITPKRQ
jgi:hypothetical protein